jgi:hypothetical protein
VDRTILTSDAHKTLAAGSRCPRTPRNGLCLFRAGLPRPGPLEARGPDGALELGGTQQRLLLAVLLMEARPVRGPRHTRGRSLAGGSAGQRTPRCRVHVSRLRRALRDGEVETVIESSPAAIASSPAAHRLDRDAFDRWRPVLPRRFEAGVPRARRTARTRR